MEYSKDLENNINNWNEHLQGKDSADVIKFFLAEFGEEMTFATSLGAEDQVITHMIADVDRNAEIFTLDTGRLFPETYKLLEDTISKYGINVKVYFPDMNKVETMVNEKGINLFYESVENRKLCCGIRKVASLKRAFNGKKAWISGLRKDQTISRFYSKLVEWDKVNNLIKINPLIDWSEKEVWGFIKSNDIPYNPLHEEGFVSIGCQPCTRAIKTGEDFRAGRWWWEDQDQKECGIHKR